MPFTRKDDVADMSKVTFRVTFIADRGPTSPSAWRRSVAEGDVGGDVDAEDVLRPRHTAWH